MFSLCVSITCYVLIKTKFEIHTSSIDFCEKKRITNPNTNSFQALNEFRSFKARSRIISKITIVLDFTFIYDVKFMKFKIYIYNYYFDNIIKL